MRVILSLFLSISNMTHRIITVVTRKLRSGRHYQRNLVLKIYTTRAL